MNIKITIFAMWYCMFFGSDNVSSVCQHIDNDSTNHVSSCFKFYVQILIFILFNIHFINFVIFAIYPVVICQHSIILSAKMRIYCCPYISISLQTQVPFININVFTVQFMFLCKFIV